jgi:methyltransferase
VHVLLVWPHNPDSVLNDSLSCCEPLPFEYLAGALREHHDVTIHDVRLDGLLESAVLKQDPGLIGVAIPYTTALRGALELVREARRLWPGVPIVIGGHHPTVTDLWLEDFPADYVIVGEGGLAFRHLADSLEQGGSFELVPGLAPFGHRPTPASLHSLDALPLPDRSVTKRHRQQYFHSIYRPVALVRFSAGCPYRCTFCILWRLTDQRYLTKRIDRIIEELVSLEVDNVYVVDDEAFIQGDRMLELAEAIGESGIQKRYHMYVRVDTSLRHVTAIERWAEIGLDSVLIGAESMEEHDLLEYHKLAHVSDTRRAMEKFHSLGIKVRANFIVRPEYTDDDFDRLADTVQLLQVDLPSFAVLTPLPGTQLFEERCQDLISDNPDLFDCYHTLFPTRLPLERFYDRVASLLEAAAGRCSAPDGTSPGVFYFAGGGAFDRMVTAVREGHRMHKSQWHQGINLHHERRLSWQPSPQESLLQLK